MLTRLGLLQQEAGMVRSHEVAFGEDQHLGMSQHAVVMAGVEPSYPGFKGWRWQLGGSWGAALRGMEQLVPRERSRGGHCRAMPTN
jgi:hypothetical protein